MRQCLIDSSQAKARIVAAALLADGGIDKSDRDVLDRHAIVDQLGMNQDDFGKVVPEFCDDMLQYAGRGDCGQPERGGQATDAMLNEIRSSHQRMVLLRTIPEVVHVDRRPSAGGAFLASRAMKRWNIQPFAWKNRGTLPAGAARRPSLLPGQA